MNGKTDTIRVDKWLWYARFFKTRTLCTALVSSGDLRVNGQKVSKPSTAVSTGDVLTFNQGDHLRIVEIKEIGTRRGPAPEAQLLYLDNSPPREKREKKPVNPKYEGKGRPTGKDRRAFVSFSKNSLE